MIDQRMIKEILMPEAIAAISIGHLGGEELLDLCYEEDFRAGTDMNVVMTERGKLVEIQGTAEAAPFGADTLGRMLKLAQKGIGELIAMQRSALS